MNKNYKPENTKALQYLFAKAKDNDGKVEVYKTDIYEYHYLLAVFSDREYFAKLSIMIADKEYKVFENITYSKKYNKITFIFNPELLTILQNSNLIS